MTMIVVFKVRNFCGTAA